jgi:hypothetical protein
LEFMKRTLASLVFLGLLLSGCGSDKKPTMVNGPNPMTFPLGLGDRWTYTVTDSSEAGPGPAYERADSVCGTTGFQGVSYFLLASRSPSGPDTTWLRQEGQRVFLVIPWPDAADTAGTFIRERIRQSLPWKVLDFTASPNTSWVLLDTSGDIPQQGFVISVSVRASVSSLGRTSLAVPGGGYDDVYHAILTVEIEVEIMSGGTPMGRQKLTQSEELFVKDAIGIVRQVSRTSTEPPGGPATLSVSKAVLTGYRFGGWRAGGFGRPEPGFFWALDESPSEPIYQFPVVPQPCPSARGGCSCSDQQCWRWPSVW